MDVAKDAFNTCCTGAICSGSPAATALVQPLKRTPPGTKAWIWKRYTESVNKLSNLGLVRWFVGSVLGLGFWVGSVVFTGFDLDLTLSLLGEIVFFLGGDDEFFFFGGGYEEDSPMTFSNLGIQSF